MERYTVKELSDAAGVTVRTLHYYHEIDLLVPTQVGANGYRYYDNDALYRLQQILFFRELGLSLKEIKVALDRPDFDLRAALLAHRQRLTAKMARMQRLVQTVDDTLLQLNGDLPVSKKNMFASFSPDEEETYRQQAETEWGSAEVAASYQRWNGYSAEKQAAIKAETDAIYSDLVDAMPSGADSAQTQAIIARWHENIHYFYEPTPEIMRGLGEMYATNPQFADRFSAIDPQLPSFLRDAIAVYCDGLSA